MKKIKLIYNPVAGNKSFSKYLDDFIKKFQKNYHISILRTQKDGKILKRIKNIPLQNYDRFIVAGGDGTVNKVVNIIKNYNLNLPLGVIPTGTVNDFASYIKMPENISKCFDIILNNNKQKVDIGLVNRTYFINVCVGGLLSKIPHNTETNLKNKLGKIGYYINAVKEFSGFESFPIRISTRDKIIEEEVILFLVLNTSRAGGFTNLVKKAKINDGYFDLIAIKADKVYKIPDLLVKWFQQKILDYENAIYLKSDYFKIELLDSKKTHHCDIDGEQGPLYPLEIYNKKQELTVFRNRQ